MCGCVDVWTWSHISYAYFYKSQYDTITGKNTYKFLIVIDLPNVINNRYQ